MKTSIITLSFFLLFLYFPSSAQIHLDGDQDVGIGTTSTNNSKVSLDNSSNAKSFLLENKANLTGIKYGIENYVRNQGLGEKYGILNRVEQNSASTSQVYGVKNEIAHSGPDSCFGMYNLIEDGGTGAKFGLYNKIHQSSTSGSGAVTGMRNEIYPDGSTECSGITNWVIPSSTSTSKYYGIFNYVDPSGGGIHYGMYCNATGPFSVAGHFEGDITVTGQINNPSDRKLKENVRDFSDAMSLIRKMTPKKYRFKDQYTHLGLSKKEQIGLIAQEVEAILPEVVSTVYMPNPDVERNSPTDGEITEIKSINYQALIPVLIQGMKEQQQRIEALEAEIEKLKKE